jgi:hypothetical protein
MDWEGFSKEEIQLGLPLLIIKGSRGFYLIEINKPFDCCGRLA